MTEYCLKCRCELRTESGMLCEACGQNNETQDYYLVSRSGRKHQTPTLCVVLARDSVDAIRVARAHGLAKDRLYAATWLGRDRYRAMIAATPGFSREQSNA